MTQSSWASLSPAEKADRVRAEIEAGAISARDVGERIGVTRNAVISVASRNAIALPDNQSEGQRRYFARPENRARIAASMKRYWGDPEHRRQQSERKKDLHARQRETSGSALDQRQGRAV